MVILRKPFKPVASLSIVRMLLLSRKRTIVERGSGTRSREREELRLLKVSVFHGNIIA